MNSDWVVVVTEPDGTIQVYGRFPHQSDAEGFEADVTSEMVAAVATRVRSVAGLTE